MTKIYSILTIILFTSASYAQSFGIEESLSLSQEAYSEIQDKDSIVQIGSVFYNVNTGEIVGVTFIEDEVSSVLEEELMGRWLAIDPFYGKYPGYSNYSGNGNNPIFWIDKEGEVLYIGGDREKALADIKSLVPIQYQNAISVADNGMIELKSECIDGDNQVWDMTDAGTQLLFDLTGATESYMYQVANEAKEYNTKAQASSKKKERPHDLTKDQNGVQNSSVTLRVPNHIGQERTMSTNKGTWAPLGNDGVKYDGIVTVRPNAIFTDGGKPKARSSVVFHELVESFERTTNKLPYDFPIYNGKDERSPGYAKSGRVGKSYDYFFDSKRDGAHDIAKQKEANFWQKSDNPGVVDVPVVDSDTNSGASGATTTTSN